MDQSINFPDNQQTFSPLPVGAIVGNYRVVQRTRSGPEGNTYLGQRTTEAGTTYQIVEYPAGEVRPLTALAKLRLEHPALLAPCEAFTLGGRAYAIIPAPQGMHPVGQLPACEALRLVITIGEALVYLHSQGVAHLRVQPSSILLADGRAYLGSLEESQVLRTAGDEALLLFERDANFLALTLGALVSTGEAARAPLEQAISKIREHGIGHSYQSVAQVIADCQQALAYCQGESPARSLTAAPALTVLAGSATSTGRVRANNEDALGQLHLTIIDGHGQACLLACFVVADGMGGEARGELASKLAVQQILEHTVRRLLPSALQQSNATSLSEPAGGMDTLERERQMREALLEGFRTANRELRLLVQAYGQAIGTTATALLIFGRQALIGHVGDSRAYRLTSGVLTTLTEDHSYIQRLIQLGQLDPAERAHHPRRNALYRALGQQDALEVDIISCPLEPGDCFLLCSDGLWEALPEPSLAQLLSNEAIRIAPTDLAARLVTLADDADGQDNSTAIVVAIAGDQQAPIQQHVAHT